MEEDGDRGGRIQSEADSSERGGIDRTSPAENTAVKWEGEGERHHHFFTAAVGEGKGKKFAAMAYHVTTASRCGESRHGLWEVWGENRAWEACAVPGAVPWPVRLVWRRKRRTMSRFFSK